MNRRKIIVVGGGPAGIMAAIRAAHFRQDVILIEKNPSLGKKLLLSGKGRCNLTNACGLDLFIRRFSKNGPFLRNAFKRFFNRDLMRFFEDRGLKLKIERQLRVFPVSDQSISILEVLKKELLKNKVRIMYTSKAEAILIEDNRVKGLALKGSSPVYCDRLILATGGLSYGFTGSSGEGMLIAGKSGHRIVRLRPGLVPLETKEGYPKLLEGLTLKNIRLRFTTGSKQIISETGELVFTSSGISGPLVLSLSGKIIDLLDANKKVYVEIDLKPALSEGQLDARLLREFRENAKKTIKNTLKGLLPVRMVDVFIDIAGVSPDKRAGQITQTERRKFVELFKGIHMDITGARPIEKAMVTRGGVSLKDIDPRTMQSRFIKGLYFAGEMIDIDADTGGFNLQAAFSTGYLAGESAAA